MAPTHEGERRAAEACSGESASSEAVLWEPASGGSASSEAASDDSVRRRRRPPEVRRAMIIDAARELIADQGTSATTIRDIASAADVAVGTVTYHFSGIAEVLAEVLQAEMAQFSAPVMQAAREATTGADGLSVLTDGLIADGDRAAQHWRLWLDFWTLAAHRELYATWQAEVYRGLHALVADLLQRGEADGSVSGFRGDFQRRAVCFIALMDGLVVQVYLPKPSLAPADARAILMASLDEIAG